MDLAVCLSDAVVLLGRFPALSGLDLEVKRGEVVLVRGANGAGKTTLLKLCAGLLRLYSGKGQVLGCDISAGQGSAQQSHWRQNVGYLGHETRLYADLTALENVAFAGKLSGISLAEATGKGALSKLRLPQSLWEARVSHLSAGQKRRVALACVLVRRPALLLLDEPHASLDADGRKCVDAVVAEASQAGATVIAVTHEAESHETDPPETDPPETDPHGETGLMSHRTVTLAGGVIKAEPSSPRSAGPRYSSEIAR